MSRKQALANLIDQRTRDYIDACFEEQPIVPSPQSGKNAKDVSRLRAEVHVLRAEVAALREVIDKLRYEDRLTLTRARLIRALKELESEQ